MNTNIISLTNENGEKYYINANNIITIVPYEGGTKIWLVDGHYARAQEKPEEVAENASEMPNNFGKMMYELFSN